MKMHCGRLLAVVVIGWASVMVGANSRDGARLENAGARAFHAAARGALEFQHTTAGRLHI